MTYDWGNLIKCPKGYFAKAGFCKAVHRWASKGSGACLKFGQGFERMIKRKRLYQNLWEVK